MPLCLPKLATLAIYMDPRNSGMLPQAYHVGGSLVRELTAQGVCNLLGRLVIAGILPTLAQVCVTLSFQPPQTSMSEEACALSCMIMAAVTCMLQVLLYPCAHDPD